MYKLNFCIRVVVKGEDTNKMCLESYKSQQ